MLITTPGKFIFLHILAALYKAGVNLEIAGYIVLLLLNYSCDAYESLHFWNEKEPKIQKFY